MLTTIILRCGEHTLHRDTNVVPRIGEKILVTLPGASGVYLTWRVIDVIHWTALEENLGRMRAPIDVRCEGVDS